MLNFAVHKIVIVIGFCPFLTLFLIFCNTRVLSHLILRQIVVLDIGFWVDEVVHFWHEEVLVVSLFWLLSGLSLPLWFGCATFRRPITTVCLATEPTAGQWRTSLPSASQLLVLALAIDILLRVLFLVFWLIAICSASFRGSVFLLDVGNHALFRLVVRVRVHHSINRFEMISLAHHWGLISRIWLLHLWLVASPMWFILCHVVVSLLIIASRKELTSTMFTSSVHLGARGLLSDIVFAIELRVEEHLSLRLNIVLIVRTFLARRATLYILKAINFLINFNRQILKN